MATDFSPASSSAPSGDSKNVFTELFGDRAPESASAVMQTVVQQEDQKKMAFFGSVPEKTVLSRLTANAQGHATHPGRAFLKGSFFLFILVTLGFSSQTHAELSFFNENPALRFELATDELNQMKAELEVQHALTATLLLDAFSHNVDEYLFARDQALSEFVSQNKRTEFAGIAEALRPELLAQFASIQSEFASSLDAQAIQSATQALDQLEQQVRAQNDVDTIRLQQELHDLETARKLLSNTAFRSFVTALSSNDVSDQDLREVLTRFGRLSESSTATIRVVQEQRHSWSSVLSEIQRLTKVVDPLFGTDLNGNLALTTLRFSSEDPLSLSGHTFTGDTKNFTVISNLIDTLEASSLFENVSNKTYQKSLRDTQYLGDFTLNFTLENSHD